jgi:hypothetical protein
MRIRVRIMAANAQIIASQKKYLVRLLQSMPCLQNSYIIHFYFENTKTQVFLFLFLLLMYTCYLHTKDTTHSNMLIRLLNIHI